MTQGTWPDSQTIKNGVRCTKDGILRDDHQTGKSRDGQ